MVQLKEGCLPTDQKIQKVKPESAFRQEMIAGFRVVIFYRNAIDDSPF
jgi:hypothetical protein